MKDSMDETLKTLGDCRFGNWIFAVGFFKDGSRYLQIQAESRCNRTGEMYYWSGRKWYLSPHMTKSEVVQTAFKAVLTALEHEARERFLYKGASIFDPHYDVDQLHDLRTSGEALSVRD